VTHKIHNDTREDPYYWLRDKDDPVVQEHLAAENSYADAVLQSTANLREAVWQEIKGRVQETDVSVETLVDSYWYYTRTVKNQAYPIYCRRADESGATEEVVLDQNLLAAEYEFFDLGVCIVSPDNRTVVYSQDTVGNEQFVLWQRDLLTNEAWCLAITHTGTSAEWDEGSCGFYYVVLDSTLRPYQVRYHVCGTDSADDRTVFTETDESFYVSLSKSKDRQYIFLTTSSKETTEVWYLDATHAFAEPRCVCTRQYGHEYYVEHHAGQWYILTNYNAPNFKICRVACSSASCVHTWNTVVPHDPETMREGLEVFACAYVVTEVRDGITNIVLYRHDTNEPTYVSWPEDAFYVQSLDAPNYHGTHARVVYSSLVTPATVCDVALEGGATLTRKVHPVPGYNSELYYSERITVTADDGEVIPVSLVRHKDTLCDGSAPGLLEGYGAYGVVEPLVFRSSIVSLLDRGFVFAIAHVRGGGEKGRRWYEAGKYRNKHNTFTDFIKVAEELRARELVSPEALVIRGGSAGGYLVGAVLNERPDLFCGAVAEVPFVDVLNTMCDSSLPLTFLEYEEWGDPNDVTYYEYIKRYAPYENVACQAYPTVLAWAGLHDTRVPYWEAAKWVARMREYTTGSAPILLKTDLSQGHGGASGRYTQWYETAYRLAFVLWATGYVKEE
jgi:oligopeptidase B